jgi:DNA-binding transcriptional regulator YdaS (Cro superfamily)
MACYDLCVAWNWEYDTDFVHLIEAACTARGVRLLHVSPLSLNQVLAGLENGEITFGSLFDRATESDLRFQPLVDWATRHASFCVNPQKHTVWSGDKATMHLEFISHGLCTPYTIILSPFAQNASIQPSDLGPLGSGFAIKPACEGGGDGVILAATSWEQVLNARQQYPHEKYLLQAHVTARILDGRPAWFRVLYCDGAVYPCWWDQSSHVYRRVTADEKARFGLRDLREIPTRIAQICDLHLFSTEIALSEDGDFLVVDYVNDPVDLRLQSKAVDGVPDVYVESIAARLARLAERHRSGT